MPTIESVQISNDDEKGLKVTMRGEVEAIIAVLAHGLPREALLQIDAALKAELEERAKSEARGAATP